jgi:hypothetical protein
MQKWLVDYCGKSISERKRDQHSSTPPNSCPKKMWRDQPAGASQYDGVGHLPWHEPVAVPSRCIYPQCKGCSRIKCEKRRLHLCLNKSKNCFSLATQNKYL